MHTDTDRMKWLNYFVQNDDHVVIERDSMGGAVITVSIGEDIQMFTGETVEDAIDQAMAEFPIPAV
jgi:hypothetical protein